MSVPLAGQVLDGRLYLFARSVRATAVRLFLDRGASGRATATLPVRRGLAGPWALDTTKLRDGAHVLLAVPGRRGKKPILKVSFRVSNHGPSSAGLIARALASHRIDYGTSLLYRFYAIWGDSRLPVSLRGGEAGDDDGIGIEAAAALASGSVRGSEAAAVSRFLLRPTDPRSPYYVRPHAGRASRLAGAGCDPAHPPVRTAGYVGEGNATAWAWTSDQAGDYAQTDSLVLDDAARALSAESHDMGAPTPDTPLSCASANPTSAPDFYVVDYPGAAVARGQVSPPAGRGGVTIPVCGGGRCSAFVLLNRADIAQRPIDYLDTVIVHEAYHVLQFAHVSTPTGLDHWFTEASAMWAQTAYGLTSKLTKDWVNYYYQQFQNHADFSLGSSAMEATDSYASWIWPFFMTQEGASVARAWAALAGASGNQSATRILDGVLPFGSHYRDFAVRDLNMPYHERGSSSAGSSFQSGPNGLSWLAQATPEEKLTDEVSLDDTGGQNAITRLRKPGSLDFHYLAFKVNPGVRWAHLDFSKLGPHVDVDLLVRVAGQGALERRKLTGQSFDMCRDDAADNIDYIVAVFSNHSLSGDQPADTVASYRTAATCDVYHLTGTITLTASGSVHNSDTCFTQDFDGHWSGTATVDETVDPTQPTPDDRSTSNLTGSTEFSETLGEGTDCGSDFSYDQTYSGAYSGQLGSNTALLATWFFDPAAAGGTPHVDVTLMFNAAGTERGNVHNNNYPGDACSRATGSYSEAEALSWLTNSHTIDLPQAGASQTISVDDSDPYFGGADPCTEGPYDVHLTGTLTVSSVRRS